MDVQGIDIRDGFALALMKIMPVYGVPEDGKYIFTFGGTESHFVFYSEPEYVMELGGGLACMSVDMGHAEVKERGANMVKRIEYLQIISNLADIPVTTLIDGIAEFLEGEGS